MNTLRYIFILFGLSEIGIGDFPSDPHSFDLQTKKRAVKARFLSLIFYSPFNDLISGGSGGRNRRGLID